MSKVRRRWYPLRRSEPERPDSAPVRARAVKKRGSIDPLDGPKLALAGRVVTMDEAFTIKANGVVYIDQGTIVAVRDRAEPAPDWLRRRRPIEHRGDDLPWLDRTAQPPQLQRATAVESGTKVVPAPRPMAGSSGLSQTHQRPDDRRWAVPRRPR